VAIGVAGQGVLGPALNDAGSERRVAEMGRRTCRLGVVQQANGRAPGSACVEQVFGFRHTGMGGKRAIDEARAKDSPPFSRSLSP
jgi:hypothetical protein